MQDSSLSVYQKTKKILEIDQNQKSTMIKEVIKSDIFSVLNSYFCITNDAVDIDISFEKDKFVIKVLAYADKAKGLNYLK